MRLIEFLKGRQIWFAGTVRINPLKNILLFYEKDLRKGGHGSFDYHTHRGTNNIAVRWYDNKTVTLVSSFVGVEPINMIRRYDWKTIKHIYVNQPNIVEVCNKYKGGIDKVDMKCSFYKASLKCHHWCIYIWAHNLVIALVIAWFLYCRNLKILSPNAKFMPLKRFQAKVTTSLIAVERCNAGRPLLDATPPAKKRVSTVQSNPTHDMRRESVNHLLLNSQKRQRCKHCKTGFSYIQHEKCNV